jgi:hypothetical protein
MLMAGLSASSASAQVRPDTIAPPRQAASAAPARPDSLRPPLSPGRAFLNSLFLPGLGQARLRRQVPGAFYATLEAVSFAMLYKTRYELGVAKARAADVVVNRYRVDPATGAPLLDDDGGFVPLDSLENHFNEALVNARRSQFEDWVTLIVFNHLFSGADAFVASLLWDVPARVGFRPAPFGRGIGLTISW